MYRIGAHRIGFNHALWSATNCSTAKRPGCRRGAPARGKSTQGKGSAHAASIMDLHCLC